MTPVPVVHIIGALPVGGVERNMLRVLPRLDRDRFRVSVVCLRERGDLADSMEEAGVPVTLVPMRTRYDPVSLWRLRGHLLREGAKIVHCHMRRANTSGRIAAFLAGVPVRIATERDMGLGKSRKHYLVDRWLAGWTDAIVCVTRGVAEHNRARSGIAPETFRVLYNGLDLERFAVLPSPAKARAAFGLPEDATVIGVVGRLDPIKNVDAVIRAMMDPRLADAHLLVVGDGRLRGELETLARDLGIAKRIRFAGFRDDLPSVYAALDAAILASSSEGIANVQLETLAAGVPLVSTPVGIAHEAMADAGCYIEIPSPMPTEIADGLAGVLEPELANRLREAGRKAVQPFAIEEQVCQFESLYESLLGEKGLTP